MAPSRMRRPHTHTPRILTHHCHRAPLNDLATQPPHPLVSLRTRPPPRDTRRAGWDQCCSRCAESSAGPRRRPCGVVRRRGRRRRSRRRRWAAAAARSGVEAKLRHRPRRHPAPRRRLVGASLDAESGGAVGRQERTPRDARGRTHAHHLRDTQCHGHPTRGRAPQEQRVMRQEGRGVEK